ncbi:MAG: tetratricopeptide repeat protein [Crocinitomicaceae bacterium]|nr:tetratricopeptide repeat protein [Crocinitomicaceae bacterium]
MLKLFIVSIMLVSFSLVNAQLTYEQKKQKDSLLTIIDQEVHDTVLVRSRYALNKLYRLEDTQVFLKQAFSLDSLCNVCIQRQENEFIRFTIAKYQGWNLELISKVYSSLGEYDKAHEYLNQELRLQKLMGDQKLIASTLNKIGEIYRGQGKLDQAVDYYMQSLAISEKIKDNKGLGITNISLGNLHSAQGDNEQAEMYINKAINYYKAENYAPGLAIAYNNLGTLQSDAGNIDTALQCYLAAYETFVADENYEGSSTTMNNIGAIYHKRGEYDKAVEYYWKSAEDAKKIKDLKRVATALNNIAHVYRHRGQYKKAIEMNTQALEYAEQSNYIIVVRNVTGGQYLMLEAAGDYKGALEYYIKYRELEDSIISAQNRNEIVRQELRYEYDKQHLADSLAFQQKQVLADLEHDRELEKQQTQRLLLFGGLAIALLFGGFIFNRFRLTKKQKEIIEEAHQELEEKNKEILDSITYAKRIQTAILPPDELIQQSLKDAFVLYKPKDIVAGDFYWMHKEQDKIIFAAADCTGHGVPGAMVSVICNNGLNRSVREFNLSEPGKILDKTRDLVIAEFEKSREEVKDGMDIALVSLELRASTESENETSHSASHSVLKYAGAHNPLWIIRNGAVDVEEIKADKQPIGRYSDPKPFNTQELKLNKGDLIYISSDGFADQFGGEKGKKFKAANFKKLLLSVQNESMQRQKELIDQAFEKWKGKLEQLDDVCIIGVRV